MFFLLKAYAKDKEQSLLITTVLRNGILTQASKRIFVVDDENDICQALKIILEKYGFRADCFEDPSKALENFKPDYYDLLILDIKMPDIDGFELYNQFKTKDPKIKALFLTALDSLETYNNQKGKVYPKKGERYFFKKPIDNKELLEAVYSMTN